MQINNQEATLCISNGRENDKYQGLYPTKMRSGFTEKFHAICLYLYNLPLVSGC